MLKTEWTDNKPPLQCRVLILFYPLPVQRDMIQDETTRDSDPTDMPPPPVVVTSYTTLVSMVRFLAGLFSYYCTVPGPDV